MATQAETDRPAGRLAITTSSMVEAGLVVAGYILCFWVGTAFILDSGVSVVWPPSGFVLAVLLRLGMRAIVPIWIGAAAANLIWAPVPPVMAVLMPGLTVSEALIGILLLRLVGFDSALRRLRDIAALVAVGAPISTLLNALAALYVMNALGITSWTSYWDNVLMFWGGNTGGILTIAPGLLILTNRGEQSISTESWIEAGLLTLLAFAALQLPVIWPDATESSAAAFIVFPIVAWVALRAPRRVSIAVVLCVSAAALLTAKLGGARLLGADDVLSELIGLQSFIACLMLTCLLLAALNLDKAQIEARLREREQFLSLAILGSNDGIWDWRPAEHRLWLSPRWKEQLGYGEDELPDSLSTWSALVHREDRDRVAQRFSDFLEDRATSFEMVQRFRHKLGHDVHILTRGIKMKDEEGRVTRVVGVHTDVTELLSAQEELRHQAASLATLARDLEEQRRTADAANTAKSQFLATMSHEIRTPMNGIIGMLSLMLDSKLNPDQKRWASTALDSAETLLTIINDILDLSKLDAGKTETELLDFDVTGLIDGVTALLKVRATAKGIALRTDIAPNVPRWLKSDPTRLRQILFNLIGNAVKFTQRGEVMVRASVGVIRADSCELRIDVTDTGIGIDHAKMPGLFEPFRQGDSGMARRFGGTGLGLAIVKRLVKLLGGSVAVQSTVNAGSTFTMILPCVIVASPLARPTAMPRDPGHGAHPRASILIAEDNDINRELVTQMLARLGHEGVTASNGREALATAQGRTFDLILMDIQMPEMDGVSAAAAIRALPGEHGGAPIVAVTANAMVGDRERYLAGGFDDYLAKPLHLDELQEVIVRWTHKPHGPAEPAGSRPVIDGARVSQIRNGLSDGELAALAERLPKELDAQIDRARHAIRANDADGVRVALRALHDSAAEFGLRELADLSDRLARDTTDLDRMVGQSAAIQDAVSRAKSGIAEVLAASRVIKE
ncbi:MAG TPA: ATP-binding protein [Dongiaceae bacterium]|nr:ATP-binding protein [Dongiaceae bacterium]